MNYEDDNKEQIDKLARMEKIYSDAEKHGSVMDKIEKAEEEDICAFPRKIFRYIMFIMWGACLFALLTGMEFLLPVCGVLFSIGIFTGLSVTKFLHESKTADAVISAVIAIACLGLAALLLVKG